jgi:hypothetical protein
MKNIIIILVSLLLSGCFSDDDHANKSSVYSSAISKTFNKHDLKIFFIGNSYTYTNNLPSMVAQIAAKNGITIKTKKSALDDANLEQHWLGQRDLDTLDMLEEGQYDFVVLQEYGIYPMLDPDKAKKYISLFLDHIKSKGAIPILFHSWARRDRDYAQHYLDNFYYQEIDKSGTIIAPIGHAWLHSNLERPDINLYHEDGSHPSELGTYLTASVIFSAIKPQLTVDITAFDSSSHYTIDNRKIIMTNEEIAFLQDIAGKSRSEYDKHFNGEEHDLELLKHYESGQKTATNKKTL